MQTLSTLQLPIGAKFIGIRHNGERVEMRIVGDEPMFCAGTETTDLCDSWVMRAELRGWEPLPAAAASHS